MKVTKKIPRGAVIMCSTADKSAFADDVTILCDGGCGKLLCHRPYIPDGPRKMCTECVGRLIEKEGTEPQFNMLARTASELALYWATPKGPKQ